jgi:ligand-binding sensor domain-containing protein
MNDGTAPAPEITQNDVDMLLARLKALREQIAAARAALAALKEKLTLAYNNYKERAIVELSAEACGPLLTLAVGPDSTCWAAGPHGLYWRKAESSWTCVLSEHALPSSGWIRTISQSLPTRVWLGTTDGLFSYHPVTEAPLPMGGTP